MRFADEHWLWVKGERRKLAGEWCETPGCVRKHVDAHHVTYERKGREWVEDIRLLCRECHDEIHDLGGPVPLQLAFADLIRAHAPSLVPEDVPDNVIELDSKRPAERWVTTVIPAFAESHVLVSLATETAYNLYADQRTPELWNLYCVLSDALTLLARGA